MARWSRSRLRTLGIGAIAVLGASLVAVPAMSFAGEESLLRARAAGDRIAVTETSGGHSAFRFQPASGDRRAPYSFVSTGGQVEARQLGKAAPVVSARTGAAAPAPRAAARAAATYPTTITVASENWTAWNKTIALWNRDTWTYVPVDNPANSLSATVSLPPGNYYAASMYGIYAVDSYLLTKAFTVTSKAQTVTLAESSAKEVAIKADDSTARNDGSAVWMALPNGDMVGFAGGYGVRTFATTVSVPGPVLKVHQILVKSGSSAQKPSPYRYDLYHAWEHPLPSSPILTVKTSSLAKKPVTIKAQGRDTLGAYLSVPMAGDRSGAFTSTSVRVPGTFTEYVTPGVTFSRLVEWGSQQVTLADHNLPAGASDGDTVGTGPVMPAGRGLSGNSQRYRDKLLLTENQQFGDAEGNRGYDYHAHSTTTLSTGGKVLKTASSSSLSVDVAAAARTYELEQTTTRKLAQSLLSTKVQSRWTFSSGNTSNYTALPLIDLGVRSTGLDARNRAGSGPVGLTITPTTRQTGAATTAGTLEWSADDGATWTELPLTASGGDYTAALRVPATATFVSLRITATNSEGGKLTRTVLRALAGPVAPGDEVITRTGQPAPATQAERITVTDVKLNGGTSVTLGTEGRIDLTATFMVIGPTGIADAGLELWHGSDLTPDGILPTSTNCEQIRPAKWSCTAWLWDFDIRYVLNSNALAGEWHAAVFATSADGTLTTDLRSAATISLKKAGVLTAADGTPEPVAKGRTITVTGTLTRADWETWTYRPYAGQTVNLQWIKLKGTTWTKVVSVRTDSAGKLKATTTASADGSFRFVYAGDAASTGVSGASDYVDVN
ncbi:hypothetical protein [Actinoplanes siamensis]|uniref:Uncharacterized protein n=1 Tax=Actinoplanes siamensis TaxID=1223317 RepID=A0A919TN19_9ACTN|nr:hypothetical protein [Actinoplanes siamensis]GIF07585.1 hypothetical protein Asi03nite_51230 [Actinoplanes siamensis]